MMKQGMSVQEEFQKFVGSIPPAVFKAALIERNSGGTGLNALGAHADRQGVSAASFEKFESSLSSLIGEVQTSWNAVFKSYGSLKEKPVPPFELKTFVNDAYSKQTPNEEDRSARVAEAMYSLLKDYQSEHPAAKAPEKKPAAPKASSNVVSVAGHTITFTKDREGVQMAKISGVGSVEMDASRGPLAYANELTNYGLSDKDAMAIGEAIHARASRVAQK